jgi:hypothetical protein
VGACGADDDTRLVAPHSSRIVVWTLSLLGRNELGWSGTPAPNKRLVAALLCSLRPRSARGQAQSRFPEMAMSRPDSTSNENQRRERAWRDEGGRVGEEKGMSLDVLTPSPHRSRRNIFSMAAGGRTSNETVASH